MSFYGTSFSFDGVSCEEFGLMLYDVDGTSQGNSKYATQQISEDRLPQRGQSLFYGTNYKNGLEFTLVFGADEHVAREGEPIDRWEMQKIAAWLTDHDEYKWLMRSLKRLKHMRVSFLLIAGLPRSLTRQKAPVSQTARSLLDSQREKKLLLCAIEWRRRNKK